MYFCSISVHEHTATHVSTLILIRSLSLGWPCLVDRYKKKKNMLLGSIDWQQIAGSCNTLQNAATHCHYSSTATTTSLKVWGGNDAEAVAADCHRLPQTATLCLTLQLQHICWYRVATTCRQLQHTATHSNTCSCNTFAGMGWQRREGSCNTLQHTAAHCNTLQHTAAHCSTLQHTAAHCNTLQHTATLFPKHLVHQKRFYILLEKKTRKKENFLLQHLFFDFTPCCQPENLEHYQSFNMLR